jgi:phytoene dehydrogenase-like protein
MITAEALRRTIKDLRRDKYAPQYANICRALNLLLKHQCDIEEQHEKQHSQIINEIGKS